jgi:hypothetical protein
MNVIIGLPIVFILVQTILLVKVLPFESPYYLKQVGNIAKMREVLEKMYPEESI